MRFNVRFVLSLGLAALLLAPLLTTHHAVADQGESGGKPRNRFGLSQPSPRTTGAIRIAAYNVLNLFDHIDDPKLQGEHDDIKMATSDERCRSLAAVIRTVDADIIALEEVESLECLMWFRDTYLPDMGYDHIASHDAGYYRGVEQSVMSRFPIAHSEVRLNVSLDDVNRIGPGWSDVPRKHQHELTMQRSPLRADIKVNGDYELTLFIVHHKSGRDFRFQREAEAVKVIELIDEVREKDPSRNIIVLGDFNAAPWDKSVRLYLQSGMIDTLSHRIIPRWRNADPEEPNLYKTHESNRVLDYILLNSAAHRELVIGSAHVYGTLYDENYDWRTDPYPKGYAADHYPVIVDLVPRDMK